VSEETAREMARGALDALEVDFAISVTGIAGPDGGSVEKPVGTVWFGLAQRDDTDTILRSEKYQFSGNRDAIRTQATEQALCILTEALGGR